MKASLDLQRLYEREDHCSLRLSVFALELLDLKLDFLNDFWEFLQSEGDLREKTIAFCLVFGAHYPDLPTQTKLAQLIKKADWPALDKLAQTKLKALISSKEKYKLTSLADGQIALDVTETFVSLFQTGIQRVVRKLAHELSPAQVLLFRLQQIAEFRPIVLGALERTALLESSPNKNPTLNLAKKLYGALKKYPLWVKIFTDLKQLLNKFRETKNNKKSAIQAVLLLKTNSPLLCPETLLTKKRLDFYAILETLGYTNKTALIFDLIPLTHQNKKNKAATLAFLDYLESLLVSFNHHLCISEDTKNKFVHWSSLKGETQIAARIESLLLAADFSKTKGTEPKPNSKLILSVGTIEPRKRQHLLLKAVDKLLDYELVFVGKYLPGSYPEFDDLLKQTQVKNHPVRVLDQIPDTELMELYQQCRFSVFISEAEGFGLPVLESLALKKPCLAARIGSIEEIAAKAGGCLLVDPESELEAGLTSLLTGDTLLNQLKKELESFHWPNWHDYAQNVHQRLCFRYDVSEKTT